MQVKAAIARYVPPAPDRGRAQEDARHERRENLARAHAQLVERDRIRQEASRNELGDVRMAGRTEEGET